MTTTLANLLLGVDMEGGENFCDSVYNFLKNQGKDLNLITNSGFGVGSRSVLTDIGAQINVTDITAGVCTTADTQDLQVGDLVKFNGGGTTGTDVYEVIALVTDTTFTIHDITITDPANVNCDEATPAFIAADVYAPDTWTKTNTLDLYRWFNHTTYHKGRYGLQVTKGVNAAEYLNAFGSIFDKDHHYLEYRGRTVTFGCWVYSVTAADNVKLQINDSDGTTESSFVAANTLTWVEITRVCGAAITSFTPRILFDGDTADVAYVSRPMLVYGSSIGEGMYQPRLQESILLEALIASNRLNAYNNQSTQAATTINLEADSDGKLPKSAKLIRLMAKGRDSGSLVNSCGLLLSPGAAEGSSFFVIPWGKTDDSDDTRVGVCKLNVDGDYRFEIIASGANTFDVQTFRYLAVQVN